MSRDHFMTDDERAAVLAQAEQERQAGEYMRDLAKVLETVEGRKVLRRWLDTAYVFGAVSAGGESTIRAAALSDYGKRRLYEVAAASPDNFLKIMLAGMQNAPGTAGKE